MKVLVTGAGAVLGQGVIRSLQASELRATIVAVDPHPYATGLYWTDSRALVPMATDPQYPARFAELLARERPDAVIPGTDVELLLFAQHRKEWESRFQTNVIVSDAEVVRIADDKYLTFQFLRDRGFPVPDSCLPGGEADLIRRVGFPLIVKPRVGARSVGVTKVTDAAALERAIRAGTNVVVQECVGTEQDEYTAGALVFDGRCDASIVMRRDLRDGNTYRAYVEPFRELNLQVKELARSLAPYGPVNFQFRLDAQQRLKVFEINARFSGTTPFRMRAGFNEVDMVLRRVLRGEPIVEPPIRPLTILRYFTETVVPKGSEVTA